MYSFLHQDKNQYLHKWILSNIFCIYDNYEDNQNKPCNQVNSIIITQPVKEIIDR
jgi:hypothetical protein